MKNKIEDLRNHLFVPIEGLLDPDKPMELDRAKAVAEVAQVMINSAKVEVDMVKALGAANGSGFMQIDQGRLK
jgi:CO dehydrogenase/acetyl-CoA synthase delta subunit